MATLATIALLSGIAAGTGLGSAGGTAVGPSGWTIELASVPGPGASGNAAHAFFAAASADASRLLFVTEERLVGADGDDTADIYERAAGTTRLISARQPSGTGPAYDAPWAFHGNGRGVLASRDGRTVAFDTKENLVGTALGRGTPLFLYVRDPLRGLRAIGANALVVGMSADGRRVFADVCDRLVAADTDTGGDNCDVYEWSFGSWKLVSAPGPGAAGPSHNVGWGGASADGSRVFFQTSERLTGEDTDTNVDVYERSGGVTRLVSAPAPGASAASRDARFAGSSADGRRVFFQTAERLVAEDTDTAVDVYERSGGVTRLLSVPARFAQGSADALFVGASADGSRVFFETLGRFHLADDDGGRNDVYERFAGSTRLLTTGLKTASRAHASFTGASADGSRVFFHTRERLATGDADDDQDVYERSAGTTTLVSAPGSTATGASANAVYEGASADGSRVFFTTRERLVASADTAGAIFERSGGVTRLVSRRGPGASGTTASDHFFAASADGNRVVFASAERLVGADTDALTDVYVARLGS